MSTTERVLSREQVQQFRNDGYLVLPGFFDKSQAHSLLQHSKDLIAGFDVSLHPLTRFATGDNDHVGDDYFLSSGDKIRYFFEEGAFDKDGKLQRPKEQSINKVGHMLHELDPEFRCFSLENPRLKQLAQDLQYHKEPQVLQSMIICKQPEIGGAVPVHDDSTFLYTDPPSALGFWFALEDCRISNGCLSFLRGSHKLNAISKRFVRKADGSGTTFENLLSEEQLSTDEEKHKRNWTGEHYQKDWEVEECDAGTLVLIDGAVIHRSEQNLSDKSRFIYTFHMIEGQAKYDERNWLQTPGRPFSKLFDSSE